MDEKMMICPACDGTGKVSACIPVPSTPVSDGIASFSAQLAEALKAQKALILAEVDKAGLTDEQFYAIRFCIPDVDLGCTSDIANCNLCEKRAVAAAQLEAIKKVLK